MMREENADLRRGASPDGTNRQLKLLTGRYWNKDKYVDFQGEACARAWQHEMRT